MLKFLRLTTLTLALFAVMVAVTGCNNTRGRLPGIWQREFLIEGPQPQEFWIFEAGEVTIATTPNALAGTVLGKGIYGAGRNRITISDMPGDFNYLEGKWRVIDIESDILRIANFDNGGMITREFVKVE